VLGHVFGFGSGLTAGVLMQTLTPAATRLAENESRA
jgi:hypothetical protein